MGSGDERVVYRPVLAHCMRLPILCTCSPEARQKMSDARKVRAMLICLQDTADFLDSGLLPCRSHTLRSAAVTAKHLVRKLSLNSR